MYTLTNGTLYYEIHPAGSSDPWTGTDLTTYQVFDNEKPATAYNKTKDSTYVTTAGTVYLKLDKTAIKVTNTTEFDPYCAWLRTGSTGSYYQEWDGYRYFLQSTGKKLIVEKVKIGDGLSSVTEWYNWDFGAAMQENYTYTKGDGTAIDSAAYYWIQWDGTTWENMSCDSYNTPEAQICSDATCSFPTTSCPGLDISSGASGVRVMNTTLTVHPASIPTLADVGLTGVSLDKSTLKYNESTNLNHAFAPGTVKITPKYYHYREETKRFGILLNWRLRTNNDEDAVFTNHYYDADYNLLAGSEPAKVDATIATANITNVQYVLERRADQRYVSITPPAGNDITQPAIVKCISLPDAERNVTIIVTVTYDNGASQSQSVTLKISTDFETIVKTEPINAPLIAGAVFGGGRMADVGTGTKVTIHNADTISAVYGGNDISGTVSGESEVLIGVEGSHDTLNTTSNGIFIGSVYGGGNGFYNYQTVSASTFGGSVWFKGKEKVDENLVETKAFDAGTSIPAIVATRVVMGSEYARVDSLFGGAKNAFITASTGNSIVVEQKDGTVYAEFGGNNVGGAIADGGAITINVAGTKPATADNVVNTRFSGFGREYGVRYLFGGGNKVDAPKVIMDVTGGTVDTCFLGGNSASITSSAQFTIHTGTGSERVFHNATVADMADPSSVNPKTWVGGKGLYNIRTLFGGNNRAAMAIRPELALQSGGIGSVYGGGNAGDMNSDAVLAGIATDFTDAKYDAPTKVGTFVNVESNEVYIDYLYGGCREANVKHSTFVKLTQGTIGAVFGGCNISGDVGSVDNAGGTYVVLEDGYILTNLFGGSNGYYHCNDLKTISDVEGVRYKESILFKDNANDPFDTYGDHIDKLIPTHNATNIYIKGGTVGANVYGGANLADVGYDEKAKVAKKTGDIETQIVVPIREGSVHFSMKGGTIKGNAFGGGNMAKIYGLSYLNIFGDATIEGALFAGNDRIGKVANFGAYTSVDDSDPGQFKASNGTALNKEEDGSWTARFSAYVNITGTPHITSVYGGGNGAYNYDGTHPEYEDIEACGMEDPNNRPTQPSAFIDIHTTGGYIDTVFGGGNGVGVSTDVTVLLNTEFNSTNNYVGTIFGGNNHDDMQNCVPDIVLLNGTVNNVFGGCNAGNMGTKTKDVTPTCGPTVSNVSTHVKVSSSSVTVLGSIFGGSNMADITAPSGEEPRVAYIEIVETSTPSDGEKYGINYVYGGNDISGTVDQTRVDVFGGYVHHIYGGSNGYYDYPIMGYGQYDVYNFKHDNSDTVEAHRATNPNYATRLATNTTGEPVVDSANVNIWGGHILSSVYGGGRMGQCRATHVILDDQECSTSTGAYIAGIVYGGGEGYWRDLDEPRRGNVTGATHVDLHHAADVATASVYGGGRGGDVYNTNITTYTTWDKTFDELYGGCWGSDVKGTANVNLNGVDDGSTYCVVDVFGGNDFTGNVFKSIVKVNSGRYKNIYGAGNGDHEATYYNKDVYASKAALTAPNNEYVELNFNDGYVTNNIYGGGNLGTTFTYEKDPNTRFYITDPATDRMVADTNQTLATAHTNPEDYSYILVNVHGGTVANNIFAGGAGERNQIIYGLKVLNMDGGTVVGSVYGGSQNVSDGYRHGDEMSMGECYSNHQYISGGDTTYDQTTLRPSSIINITGGNVQSPVYGGGYLGNIFGSVFINVGYDAVQTSPVWTNTYNGVANAYSIFKPGYTHIVDGNEVAGHVPALAKNRLSLDYSIYGGANWGENSGNANFDKQGFWGGENMILIDGNGYNTGQVGSGDYVMDINKAIIGSGTSANGGDVWSHIEIRNFGVLGNDCDATRKITTIQRADALLLHNTVIQYIGANEAVSVHESQPYTINRIDTVNFWGYNVASLKQQASNIIYLNFWEDELNPSSAFSGSGYSGFVPAARQNIYNIAGTNCDETRDICTKLGYVDNTDDHRYTAILVNNGTNIDVQYPDKLASYQDKTGGVYGLVRGFAFLEAEPNTNAVVTARFKVPNGSNSRNTTDGGFLSDCNTENELGNGVGGAIDNTSVSWTNCSGENCNQSELPYHNYQSSYRVWAVGDGRRTRYTVVLAHSNPSSPKMDPEVNKPLLLERNGEKYKFSMASAVLTLPPTEDGHWYELDGAITLSTENNNLTLTDVTWDPGNWNNVINHDATNGDWHDYGQYPYDPDNSANGQWRVLPLETGVPANALVDVDAIANDPNGTFGLLLTSGKNFGNTYPTLPGSITATGQTILSGNANVSINANYASAMVADHSQTQPEMNLYMLYDSTFSNTMLGTVTFSLKEYTLEGGVRTPVDIGNVDVVVTISTIIEEFRDMEDEVLAIYNEGRRNTFTRKIILPATLESSDIYIKDITWVPTQDDGSGELQTTDVAPAANRFILVEDTNVIIASADNNLFGLTIWPTDNISSDIENNIGWPIIYVDEPVNFLSAARDSKTSLSTSEKISAGAYSAPVAIDLSHVDKEGYVADRGLHLGKLDGRGLSALEATLHFNGENIYPDVDKKGYVGKATLTMLSEAGSKLTEFKITLNVKVRRNGDTIYVASTDHFRRNCDCDDDSYEYDWLPATDFNDPDIGKRPTKYVNNLYTAIRRIYQEGDVIAIMDKYVIDGTDNIAELAISGTDYTPLPIIRYFGHHKDLPGECGVYRGPLIEVKGKYAKFSAKNISFDGSSMGWSRTNIGPELYNPYDNGKKYADTNVAFGPILQVTDHANVELLNGVDIENNYNGYVPGQNGYRTGTDYVGPGSAFCISQGATVTLINNITITHNTEAAFDNNHEAHPQNGAVHIDQGILQIKPSAKTSRILITDNYIMPQTISTTGCGTTVANTKYFDFYKNKDDENLRYQFDPDAMKNELQANVLLNRTYKGASDEIVKDDQISDVILVDEDLAATTRIGISKWFPGEIGNITGILRDTIQIVRSPGTKLQKAMDARNFIPDNPAYRTLFTEAIEPNTMYLHRCATFQHQLASSTPLIAGSDITPTDVLQYLPDDQATCPAGGERIVYSVMGGFFPYTYNWTDDDNTYPAKVKGGTNINMDNNIDKHDYTNYRYAIADTFTTSHIDMGHTSRIKVLNYTVTASDVAGCQLQKQIEITLNKSTSTSIEPGFYKEEYHEAPSPRTSTEANWTSKDNVVASGEKLSPSAENTVSTIVKGTRYYKAITITPMVWTDRTQGTISAKIDGSDNDYIYQQVDENRHELEDLFFCEGEVIQLATRALGDNKFIMWDFDPYYASPTTFVVPARSTSVTAYYGPDSYWVNAIRDTAKAGATYSTEYNYTSRPTVPSYTVDDAAQAPSTKAGYVTAYNGDVHIYNENGLAWFISVVNGHNNTQIRSFFFNNVYLHDKAEGYDMRNHLWTPVGTTQHRFRGHFIGVGSDEATTTPAASPVTIRNIIVNEPNMDYAGFFAFLDSAEIKNIALEAEVVHGSQFVGGIAAYTYRTEITDCKVESNGGAGPLDDKYTSLLTTHYTSGGMVGKADETRISGNTSNVKFLGDAIFCGGVVGYGTSTRIENNGVGNLSRMEGLYVGGAAGYLDGTAPASRRAKRDGNPSVVANNYIRFVADHRSQRVGGVVGYADNTLIENNYVFGDIDGQTSSGAVGAVLSTNAAATNNYYAATDAKVAVGTRRLNATIDNTATFSGRTNHVVLDRRVDGARNLTQALNIWVRNHNEQGGDYRTWRSDLEYRNYGYPLFGEPDLVPVTGDSIIVDGCESAEWNGTVYTNNTVATYSVIDSTRMVDSTVAAIIRIHHGAETRFEDSAYVDQSYTGYGFHVSRTEAQLLQATVDSLGSATITLTDTLHTLYGCDSVVTLTLTFTDTVTHNDEPHTPIATPTQQLSVSVYPNPTVDAITVEAEGMTHVELYSTEGRRLQDYLAEGEPTITIDLTQRASGAYYLRVHSPLGVTIQKIVKL
ncbi:MAG: T9SS type A sorting domain-containing protein [Bacteroidales bacterium]|nr:T9SS type A sorting domain-containing protein [Bacteroidales bacterium]